MERASKAVWNALKRLADPEKPIDFLTAVWPLVVGARMAEYTRPLSWDRGQLQVGVSDLEWQRQLERMSHSVRHRINDWWGSGVVEEVTFVRARATGSTPQPVQRKRKRAKPSPAAKEGGAAPALKELEQPLSRIRDPELRELVARLAEKYLSGKKG